MTKLTAVFELIDKVSDKMDAIANSGSGAVDKWQKVEDVADSAFDAASKGVAGVAQTAQSLGDAIEDTVQSFDAATDAADYWTDAIGNYDKSAMEAIYTTEELVEMGFKTEDALEAEAKAAEEAEEAIKKLGDQSDDTGKKKKDMGDKGSEALNQISNTLASAGIVKGLQEIAEAAYELADSFTQAEKVIIGATGATGKELDALMESTTRVFANSNAENLYDVAAGMTAVQKATGLAGDELEQATSASIVLNDVLGYDVSQTAKTASALMKNFGLSAEEAYDIITAGAQSGADKNGDLLDILNEYAAQYAALGLSADEFLISLINGADAGVFSIDKVGDAVKEFNIRAKDGSETSAEAFEALGMDAEEMTARFAAGGETASTAFFEVVSALNAMDDPMEKNAAAVGLFGTMYEDLEANLLPILANIEGGTIDVHGALETVTSDATSLSDNWQEASNSVSTAFTTAVEPAVSGLSSGVAGVVKSFGDFLQEHPAVTKAITAIGVGLAAVVLGITGVVFVTQVAIPAVTAFGVALNTALGPIGWVALAVTGVVAAVGALIALFQKEETEYDTWTATTKAQYDALQDLNAEYEEACDTYGETSEEALRLKYEMDDLNASFEANKMTVEEFVEQCNALVESHNDLAQSYAENTASIHEEEVGSLALIQKLEDLAMSTEQTASTQMQMQSIIDTLNEKYPDLALNIEDVTTNTDAMVTAIKKAAEEQAKQEQYQESYDTYVELLKEQALLEDQIAAATENVRLEQEKMDNMSGWQHFWTSGEWDDLESYEEALEELQAALAENRQMQQQCENTMEEYADSVKEAEEATVSYEDAVERAISSVQEEMDELCKAYDEAYEAARDSIDGQIGLFDEMETKSELSVKNMQDAFQSQIDYLNTYTENLRKAAEYGLDDGLIASLSDGSEESAGYLNAIIENVEKLGASSEDAQKFVDDFNTSFQEVESAKDEFATTVATMETDFDEKMSEIEGRLNDAIDEMNMEEDAAAAAKETMEAYTQAIRDGTANAVSAAESAAAAVAAALDTSYTGGVTTTVAGHASGTTNAEDIFVAGENGPELIVGAGGSTVFPADETSRIINAVNGETGSGYTPPGYTGSENVTTETSGGETTKKVVLAIEGKGNIELTGGKADKETLIAFLYEYLKPVLSEILTEEIFEEGDMSYEY